MLFKSEFLIASVAAKRAVSLNYVLLQHYCVLLGVNVNVFSGGGARVQRTARMPMGGWEEEPVAEEYELPPHVHKV